MTLATVLAAIEALPAKINALLTSATEASAKLTAAEQRATEAEATLANRNETITSLTAERDRLAASVTTLTTERDAAQGEVAQLKASAKTAEERAHEAIAKVGVDAVPASDTKAGAAQTHLARYQELAAKDPMAAAQYYAKHRNDILQ